MALPERVLILLTTHRSGSTWLSDAIRCHPCIEYHPDFALCKALGVRSRRYPRDLSNLVDCTYEIEVQSDQKCRIPVFDLFKEAGTYEIPIDLNDYALEKLHPSFFNFELKKLLKGIESLEKRNVKVKFIYLVRDPKSTMSSFLEYQERKPEWYCEVTSKELPEMMLKTYNFLNEMTKFRQGLAIGYSELKQDFAWTLLDIFIYLWEDFLPHQEELVLLSSERAIHLTSRMKRMKATSSPFLGHTEGSISGGSQRYQTFFLKNSAKLKQCYSSYHKLLEM